jgi:polyisoprenoid-binding protein YceI
MKLKIILLLLLSSTFVSFSQVLFQNKTASEITFKIKNFGLNVDGIFKDFTISSNFNSANIEACFFNAKISVNSIFTDAEGRDKHLLESDYFDVEKHPKIVFESTAIQKTINSNYLLKGFLTIKGVEKRVATILEVVASKSEVRLLANFSLNRRDFGVGSNSFVLSDEVNIKMIYVATKN